MSANKKAIILCGGVLLALLVVAATYVAPRWLNAQGHDDHAPVAQDPHAAHGQQEREVLYWYDPMHPEYRSDKPGIAPDCGMQLVAKYADEVEAVKDMPPGTVMLSAQRQQLIGVRTAPVRRERLQRTIRTVGRVRPDETRLALIHVKVAGWAENVYVDFIGKLVRKGEPLFTLYSPELVSTQREYLLARRGVQELGDSAYPEVSRAAHSLLRAAEERLRLWDISAEQIERLEKTGEVTRTMTIFSPVSGFVLNRTIFPQAYLTPEMRLYELADLSRVWVDADVYEYEAPYVQLGMPARVSLSHQPKRTWQGRVAYIHPSLDAASRTLRVRLELANPGLQLKPEMFADVELSVDYGVQLLVPAEAVLDSGRRQLVFLARPGGVFEPREVEVGPRLDENYAIRAGLNEGDVVVTSGNFLIDSESRLGAAMEGMEHVH